VHPCLPDLSIPTRTPWWSPPASLPSMMNSISTRLLCGNLAHATLRRCGNCSRRTDDPIQPGLHPGRCPATLAGQRRSFGGSAQIWFPQPFPTPTVPCKKGISADKASDRYRFTTSMESLTPRRTPLGRSLLSDSSHCMRSFFDEHSHHAFRLRLFSRCGEVC